MERAVSLTGMEYGGITPIGLPPAWPILVDERVSGDLSRRHHRFWSPPLQDPASGLSPGQLPNVGVLLEGLGIDEIGTQ